MEYRLDKAELVSTLTGWSRFVRRKVHLIACGGTALTLLDIKASTKDIDFMVPNPGEHNYLIQILSDIGYKSGDNKVRWTKQGEMFDIDLFRGNRIHTTELLNSPLEEGNNIFLQNVGQIYIGILNFYDLICSKLFRGEGVDFDDCLMLVRARAKEIDRSVLVAKYDELVKYQIGEKWIEDNAKILISRWDKEGG